MRSGIIPKFVKFVATLTMVAALGAQAAADLVADCSTLAPSVAASHKAILAIAGDAAAQGDAAIDLAGTRRRYGPSTRSSKTTRHWWTPQPSAPRRPPPMASSPPMRSPIQI
jgi:hypothetical protein